MSAFCNKALSAVYKINRLRIVQCRGSVRASAALRDVPASWYAVTAHLKTKTPRSGLVVQPWGWMVLTVEFCLFRHAISCSCHILMIQISHDGTLTVSRRRARVHVFLVGTDASSDLTRTILLNQQPNQLANSPANYQHTYLPTYLMEQSPSWEANSSLGSFEIPSILWNPRVHHRVSANCPSPEPEQSNHVFPTDFFTIHFNIVLLSMPGYSRRCLSFMCSHQNPLCTYPF